MRSVEERETDITLRKRENEKKVNEIKVLKEKYKKIKNRKE